MCGANIVLLYDKIVKMLRVYRRQTTPAYTPGPIFSFPFCALWDLSHSTELAAGDQGMFCVDLRDKSLVLHIPRQDFFATVLLDEGLQVVRNGGEPHTKGYAVELFLGNPNIINLAATSMYRSCAHTNPRFFHKVPTPPNIS